MVALWKNKFTFTIVRAAAPNLQVIVKQYTSVSDVIANFDLGCCQVAWVNNFRGDLLATWQAVDAITSRSVVARPGINHARLKKWVKRGFSAYVSEATLSHWDPEAHRAHSLKLRDFLGTLENETRLAGTFAPQIFGMSGIKQDTDELQLDWVLEMSRAGNIAATIAEGEAGPNELIYGGAGVPSAPSSSMFALLGINKHRDTRAFVATLVTTMHTTIDVGYLTYAKHAGPANGVLRMERYPDHSNVARVVHSMFANPLVPCSVTLHETLHISRARAALDSSVAHWARRHGTKLLTVEAWDEESALIEAAMETDASETSWNAPK